MISKMGIRKGALDSVMRMAAVLSTLLVAIVAAGFAGNAHAADMFKGRQIYASNCAICHGQSGRSVLPGAPNFANQEGLLKPDMTLLATIRSGRNAMPAFQGVLSDRDIMDVIAFIRTLN